MSIISLVSAVLLQGPVVAAPISIPEISAAALTFSEDLRVNSTEPNLDLAKAGLPISVFLNEGPILPASIFSAKAWLGWTGTGLIAHVSVEAPHATRSTNPEEPFNGDSVEFFFRKPGAEQELFQIVVTPAFASDHEGGRAKVFDYRLRPLRDAVKPSAFLASRATANGYEVTIAVPWKVIGVEPRRGETVGTRLTINHVEPGHPRSRLIWTGNDEAVDFWSPPVVRLDRVAGRLNPYKAWVQWDDDLIGGSVFVMGESGLSGQSVKLRFGDLYESEAKLAVDGDRTVAAIRLPGPKPGERAPDLDVTVGGVARHLTVPDVFSLRTKRFMEGGASGFGRRGDGRLIPALAAEVFSTSRFPSVAYPDPHYVEELVGPVALTTRFFNGQYQEVVRADHPGRYIAKVDVSSPAGAFTTYRTLFRAPDGWNGEVNDAVTAAARFEGLLSPLRRPDAAKKAEQDSVHALRKLLGTQVKYEYEVKVPGDYVTDSSRKWPLIVFLHGSGGGDDQAWPTVKVKDGPMDIAHRESRFPFIVVALRSPGGWFPPAVEDAIDDVELKYRVDKSRVYLAGFSMGGFGTWRTAYDQPTRFAAIVPVAAGSGDAHLMPLLEKVPTWVFNGGADVTTSPVLARSAVEALKRAGGTVRYTEYPGEGHGDALRLAFADKELYDWLLQFRSQ